MWKEIEEAAAKKRHEVRITGKVLQQKLEEDPAGLEQLAAACPHLTFIDLSEAGSSLEELPANFSQLLQLHELKCTHNHLRVLPSGLGNLPLLRTVILEGNLLQELPVDLFRLPRLHTLQCSHNQLTSLPDQELLAATELHYLDVSHNKLTGLPLSITKLPKLSVLMVSYNPGLSALPSKLSALAGLLELQAAHCGITTVPQALAAAPKLKALQLEGNPFEDKKLPKVLKEGRLKNILTHIKKHGAPLDAAEAAKEAAAAAAKLHLAEVSRPYKLLSLDKDAKLDVEVHAGVKDVRPHLVCAVLRDVSFTPSLFEAFIQLQTDLHEGPCKKRSVAAIGTHDLDTLALPLSYEALPPADISFVPLIRDKGAEEAPAEAASSQEGGADSSSAFRPGQAITAAQLEQYFAGDKSMLKYLSYITGRPSKAAPLYAVLRDARGAVLSVSPVINAQPCRVTPTSTNILLEVSGSEGQEQVQQMAAEFLERFGKACKAQSGAMLQVAPVRLLTPGTGHVRLTFPNKQ